MTILHKKRSHDKFSDSVYVREYISHGYKTQYITCYLAITNREVYLNDKKKHEKINRSTLVQLYLCATPLERSSDEARLNGQLAMSEPHTGTENFPGTHQYLGRSGLY